MKKICLLFFAAAILLASCNSYGDKVKINDKSEVYYRGDGVTEADAKKLGDFLLKQGLFDDKNERSVQLSKDSGAYVVRFVFDKATFEKDKETTLLGFQVWQMWISENVFNSAKTKVVLADNKFKDFQQIPEFTAEEKAAAVAEQEMLKEGDNTAGDSTVAPSANTVQ